MPSQIQFGMDKPSKWPELLCVQPLFHPSHGTASTHLALIILLFIIKGAKEEFVDIFGQHIFSVQKVQPKVSSIGASLSEPCTCELVLYNAASLPREDNICLKHASSEIT